MSNAYDPAPPRRPDSQYYPPQPRSAGWMAVTALVVGIISAVLALIPFVGLLFAGVAVITLILGIVAWASAANNPARTKGVAVAATIVSALAIVIALVSTGVTTLVLRPYAAKVQAVIPESKAAAQAVEAAQKAGADRQAVDAAMEVYVQDVTNAVKDEPDADAAKAAAGASLAALQAKLDALPKSPAPTTLPAEAEPEPEE